MGLATFFKEIPGLLFIAIIGYLLIRFKLINSETVKGISAVLMYAALPALIIVSFSADIDKRIFIDFTEALIVSASVYIFLIILSSVVFRKGKGPEYVIARLSMVFSNCAFIGIPIITSLFGNEGIIYTSIFIFFYNIFLWTYGVKAMQNNVKIREGLTKVLFNPGSIAMIAGLAILFSGIVLPYALSKPLSLLGSLTTPLAMIIVGALFAGRPIRHMMTDKKILLVSIARLLVVPIMIMLIFKLIGFSGLYIEVIIMLCAMPVATTIAIFAEQFDVAPVFGAGVIGHSTIFSVITIPFIFYILKIVL